MDRLSYYYTHWVQLNARLTTLPIGGGKAGVTVDLPLVRPDINPRQNAKTKCPAPQAYLGIRPRMPGIGYKNI
jgi:hypothetical protein